MKNKKTKAALSFKQLLPLFILIILTLAVYLSPLRSYFNFETLQQKREQLKLFVETHFILAPFLFITFYIFIAALSIPGAAFVTIFGGFLFPQPFSTIYVITGATIGAGIIFLVAKTAIGDYLRQKAGPFFKKMEKGLQENAVNYLLFLRLVPLFPFWAVNLAPAFFGIKLRVFIFTTFFGIAPGSFVYAQAGNGLGAILDNGDEFSIKALFNWKLRIALIALGILILIPIFLKRRKNSV